MTAVWVLAALAGHAALCTELVNRSHGFFPSRVVAKSTTAICGIALLGLPVYAATTWPLCVAWQPTSWLDWYATACAALAPIWLLARIALAFDPVRDRSIVFDAETIDLGERLGDAATGSAAIQTASRLPGNPLLRVEIERRTLFCPRLPPALEGLRIAHLTDLHMSSRLGRAYFEEIVRQANEAEPDLVCLTGDIVEHAPQLEWVESVLSGLESRVGSFFVLGNHDAYLDSDELRHRLEAIGFTDASRRGIQFGLDRGGLFVCGDERPWFRRYCDPPSDAAFTIALLHTPDRFAWAARHGIDVALAGHTHGGQIRFPLLGPLLCPSRHGVRYASGDFHRGRTRMHVSRGSGSLFPLRYGCPPELGILTLRSPDQNGSGSKKQNLGEA